MIFRKNNEHLDWPKYVNDVHYLYDERISIHKSAYISAFTNLGTDIYIGAGTLVSPRCFIGSHSVLKSNVTLQGNVTIGPEAFLGVGCLVNDKVVIPAHMRIGHHIHVLSTPTCISGSRHSCYWFEPGILAIGCEQHFIEYWLYHHQEIGKGNGYSVEQSAEYYTYIRFFAANPCRSLELLEGKV